MRSYRVMLAVVGVMSVVAVTLVAIAVITDDSPTFLGVCATGPDGVATRYEPNGSRECPTYHWAHVPIKVRVEGVGQVSASIVEAASRGVRAVNEDVGFRLLQLSRDEDAPIVMEVGAASQPGWRDPGGDARLRLFQGHVVACEVALTQVPTLTLAESVSRHELYHCLSLAHDPEDETSIMSPTQVDYDDLQLRPRLRDRDRQALRDVYLP